MAFSSVAQWIDCVDQSGTVIDINTASKRSAPHRLQAEAKPEPNKGPLQIAIGQLFDYRRFLRNRTATDLAVLTIARPDKSYIDLLASDGGITALWFDDEAYNGLKGEGRAWQDVLRSRNQLK
jgi:hypothetical protein